MMVKNKTRYIKRNIKETTSRKQMESELIKSESRYRNLVEFSPEAICTLKAGKINLINVSGSMLLGALSPLQLIGKPLIDFIHPEYQETVAGRIQEILTTKRDTHWLEVKIIRLDGSIIEVEAKASLLTDEEEGVQLIAHNVTHYKEAEREIIRLIDIAKH